MSLENSMRHERSRTEKATAPDSIDAGCLEQANPEGQEADCCFPGAGGDSDGNGLPFGWMRMFRNQTGVAAAQPCECAKCRWLVLFEMLDFMLRDFYPDNQNKRTQGSM